jgi:putative holliday junction resolvase
MLAEKIRAYGEKLASELSLPVSFVDERLTTMEADRMLTEEADVSRGKRRQVRDKIAASLILQSYLDTKK